MSMCFAICMGILNGFRCQVSASCICSMRCRPGRMRLYGLWCDRLGPRQSLLHVWHPKTLSGNRGHDVKALLIFPPASDPAHPPLGIAALAGYLREKGEQVDLLDLNLMSYEYLLSSRHINTCIQKIEHRISELERSQHLADDEAVEFSEDIRKRKRIAPLAKFFALSRSHLFFLPPKDRPQAKATPAVNWQFSEPDKVFPIRRPGLVPRSLGFDIENIDASDPPMTGAKHTARRMTNYAYSPEKDKLVNVGDHGLGPCDGRHSLADILETVGPDNHETVVNYYRDLSDRELLTWEIRC